MNEVGLANRLVDRFAGRTRSVQMKRGSAMCGALRDRGREGVLGRWGAAGSSFGWRGLP